MTLRAETLTYWFLHKRGPVAADWAVENAERDAGLFGPRVTGRRAHKGGWEIKVTGYRKYDGR